MSNGFFLTANAVSGAVGVGVATTVEKLTFVEEPTFKIIVGVMGLLLVCVTVYNVFLDIRIKKRKLENDE